jgi:hypothetical protein
LCWKDIDFSVLDGITLNAITRVFFFLKIWQLFSWSIISPCFYGMQIFVNSAQLCRILTVAVGMPNE